jgi:hypothetical protein
MSLLLALQGENKYELMTSCAAVESLLPSKQPAPLSLAQDAHSDHSSSVR